MDKKNFINKEEINSRMNNFYNDSNNSNINRINDIISINSRNIEINNLQSNYVPNPKITNNNDYYLNDREIFNINTNTNNNTNNKKNIENLNIIQNDLKINYNDMFRPMDTRFTYTKNV